MTDPTVVAARRAVRRVLPDLLNPAAVREVADAVIAAIDDARATADWVPPWMRRVGMWWPPMYRITRDDHGT